MVEEKADPAATSHDDLDSAAAEDFGHPRGTLVIVILYGLLFALGWLGLYVFQFLGRGAPRP